MSAITTIAVATVAVAVVLIVAQVWDLMRSSTARGQENATSTFPLQVMCPQTKAPAFLRVGVATEALATRLTVLACDRFPDGTLRCHQECLLGEARPAA